MFNYHGVLDYLLAPGDYWSEQFHREEISALFSSRWQFVGLRSDLAAPGDYLARDVLGVPVLIRNAEGALTAYKNVCAHRHCLVIAPGKGNAPVVRCQYHAWEYGKDGRISRMPDGVSFKGISAKDLCLDRYRVDTLGDLVFVNLHPGEESFLESMGDLGEDLARYYGDRRLFWHWSTDHPVNWKVIAENAIESYHVPATHPNTFRDYRDESLHDHRLDPRFTRYRDLKPWGSSAEGRIFRTMARILLREPNLQRFTQAHAFPNYLLYYGDLFSSFIYLDPLGPESTRHIQIGFVPEKIRAPFLTRPLQSVFTASLIRIIKRIMLEDMRIWRDIQHGLRNSEFRGTLSCREERVYAFQKYVTETMQGRAEGPGAA